MEHPSDITLEIGTEGILHFINHYTNTWHQLLMSVVRADRKRMRLMVLKPTLPYPAVWDMHKLIALEEVWFMAGDVVIRGHPFWAGLKHITLSHLAIDTLPSS